MRRIALLLLAVLWIQPAALAADNEAPRMISVASASDPFWVSRFAVVDEHGQLRRNLPAASVIRKIEWSIAEQRRRESAGLSPQSVAGPCPSATLVSHRTKGDIATGSWTALKEGARAIFRGTVGEVVPGFADGAPASLLRIERIKPIARAAGYPVRGPIFVTYFAADFRVEGVRFCNAVPGADYAPAIGDDVLVFAIDAPPDAGRQYLPVLEEQLVFQRGDQVVLPVTLRDDPLLRRKSLDDLAAEVRRERPARQKE